MMTVYLAGPITGHAAEEISSWRASVRERFRKLDFLDPALSVFDATEAFEKSDTESETLARLDHGRHVLDRDKTLIERSDLVLANFLGVKNRVSIGTVGELFWANSLNKRVIIIREKAGNIHDHAMLNAIASRICHSLEEGFEALEEMLKSRAR
jgi:nucleoside 2-deoxyribosyltransferase